MDLPTITDVATLEACVGKLPGPRDLKVMDHLDDSARRWLALSPLAFFCFGDASGAVAITPAGGAAGFAQAPDAQRLRLPLSVLDHAAGLRVGAGFGSLFLLPGIDETLRVNGRVAAVDGAGFEIALDECYLHCAKALMRSAFWSAQPHEDAPADAVEFLHASRFMALATIDRAGRADLSPKGDPAGALLRWHDAEAWYADRPGNRRVDSFRNLLTQPRLAAVALVPGSTRVLLLRGTAQITADAAMRAAFAVGERVPKIVTRVQQAQIELRHSAALARVRPWPSAPAPADIDPAAIFVAHVRHSKVDGLAAKVMRTALKLPGLMQKGLDNDYKNNLY